MKRAYLIIPVFVAALIIAGRMLYIRVLTQSSFTPQPISAPLAPPIEAYEGRIRKLSGDVKKFARDAEDFEIIDKTAPVLQGEIIATGENGSIKVAMEKMDDIIIDLEKNTEVEFAHLVYPSVLLRHRQGQATYATTVSSFSIRILNTLVELGTGAVSITKKDQTVTVRLEEGTAKLAVVGEDNETRVWKLDPGDRAVVSETETVVYTK